MNTAATVTALFTLARIPVQRVWQLPNGYLGTLQPLSDHEILRDRSEGGLGYTQTCTDREAATPTINVVRDWMQEYQWRFDRPAWLVKTPFGLIQIGWRKRVIDIDWSETSIRAVVTPDDVTKSETGVHAWSEAKAVEYLAALRAQVAGA